MPKNNTVHGYDIDEFPASEIVKTLRLHENKDCELLEAFLELKDAVDYAWAHRNTFASHESDLICAVIAYEVYKRFYGSKEDHPMFNHPSLSSDYIPNSIHFWNDPVAIDLLYKTMIEDGFYQPSTVKGSRKFMPASRFYENGLKEGNHGEISAASCS